MRWDGSRREYLLDSFSLPQLTKELSVQILSIGVAQALGGVALPLQSLLSSVGVNGGHDNNLCLVDQLRKQ